MSQLYSIKLQEFDLIIIGTGSGLYVANTAYQHGLRVAVIEKDRMGGTCLRKLDVTYGPFVMNTENQIAEAFE
jgi:UDP-galactopyranose mutase